MSGKLEEEKTLSKRALKARTERALTLINFLRDFKGRTCSVFGMKAASINELRIIQQVAFSTLGVNVRCVGVLERSEKTGTIHSHVMVFKTSFERNHRGTPTLYVSGLTKAEETMLVKKSSAYLSMWRLEGQKNIRENVKRWWTRVTRVRALNSVDAYEKQIEKDGVILYRVPVIEKNGVKTAPGISGYAAQYCLKSMWAFTHQHNFMASYGLDAMLSLVRKSKKEWTSEIPDSALVHGYENGCAYSLLSTACWRIWQELEEGVAPDRVAVYVKNGQVYVKSMTLTKKNTDSPFFVRNNKLMLVRIEIMRRHIVDLLKAKVEVNRGLVRAVDRVSTLWGLPVRFRPLDDLVAYSVKKRQESESRGVTEKKKREEQEKLRVDQLNQRMRLIS